LRDCRGADRFERVTHFIAADSSGSFGILARHAPLLAVLDYGLARFLDAADEWHYVALPGGVLRFADNALSISTVRYFLGKPPDHLVRQLDQEMRREDSEVHQARATLDQIERSLVRRLAELGEASGRTFAR
jgi:F-type H+-transporting ATPase subunit epsilon